MTSRAQQRDHRRSIRQLADPLPMICLHLWTFRIGDLSAVADISNRQPSLNWEKVGSIAQLRYPRTFPQLREGSPATSIPQLRYPRSAA